jgi:uncharacterized protein YxjI
MSDLSGNTALAYPLTLRFKLIAISNQFELIDGQGKTLGYVKQPWAKIKEAVSVYKSDKMDALLFTIKADRIIDLRAKYTIADAQGRVLGELQRHMVKSWFKSTYTLSVVQSSIDSGFGRSSVATNATQAAYTVTETNPWVKVLDSLISEIPVIGSLAGFFLHPRYAVLDASGVERIEIRKRPSFFERKFDITALNGLEPSAEKPLILGALMMILLESKRG